MMDVRRSAGPVLVGADGSETALDAVRWAAEEAALRHAPLRLLTVTPALQPGLWADPWLGESYRRAAAETARAENEAALEVARAAAPGVGCAGEWIVGRPAAVLAEESRLARLTVVGSRGRGGFAGLLLGSVALGLAAEAGSPLVVVRGSGSRPSAPDGGGRPVVVGVDGSPRSEAAVAVAFEEADLRSAPLVAVHTYLDEVVYPPLTVEADWERLETEERAMLAERLAGWSGKYPDVRVRGVVRRERAAGVLVEESRYAQLVVVGTRGHGHVTGPLVGSVSQALLRHAACPVLVARSSEAPGR
jgi:nucleotide-binding universal stress UspA family protein